MRIKFDSSDRYSQPVHHIIEYSEAEWNMSSSSHLLVLSLPLGTTQNLLVISVAIIQGYIISGLHSFSKAVCCPCVFESCIIKEQLQNKPRKLKASYVTLCDRPLLLCYTEFLLCILLRELGVLRLEAQIKFKYFISVIK